MLVKEARTIQNRFRERTHEDKCLFIRKLNVGR